MFIETLFHRCLLISVITSVVKHYITIQNSLMFNTVNGATGVDTRASMPYQVDNTCTWGTIPLVFSALEDRKQLT